MKTVRDACELQPNALSIKLSDQIEQLDELIRDEGEGERFFEKTHITQGMLDLITEGIARLAGKSSQAAFHLKQATHSILDSRTSSRFSRKTSSSNRREA
jgi:hypothetical protein